jgi:hypothetical protein
LTRQFFGDEATEIRIVESRDPRQAHAKKCAFVVFSSALAVKKALRKRGQYLDGCRINVEEPKR